MKKLLFSIAVVLALVALAGCSSSASPSGGTLTGQVWALTDLAGKAPLKDTGITIQFSTDNTVSGSSGCNQYNGTYTASGSSLAIKLGASTMMACAQPVMDQESAYQKALGDVKAYTVSGDKLTLFGADNKEIASYKATSQDLAGTSWQVIGYNNGKQAVVSILAGTQMDIQFGKDGTVSGESGCNTYNGPYTVNGNQIKIGPLASTMMACSDPAGIMDQEQQYLAALGTAATYQVENNVLELRTADGALAADFNKK
ncbi:MAG: META domain-containing protein [Bacteroidota bacterium]